MLPTLSALVGLVLAATPGEPLSADDAFAKVTSLKDVHTAVMKATVGLAVEEPSGQQKAGTGFFVWKRGANGRQRVFLVTAAHVLEPAKLGGHVSIIGRSKTGDGRCFSEAWGVESLDGKRKPRWLERKEVDLAVLEIDYEDRIPCVAISVGDLAKMADVKPVGLGDEVFAVGYPSGFQSTSANDGLYGFLRAGKVAGYPVLSKADSAPGIFFDASVEAGYSGAPVYWLRSPGEGGSLGVARPRAVVLGVVTRFLQGCTECGEQKNIQIGFAVLAAYAREMIENAK